jgi:enoyl-CoA hydratase/carnithine racemase
MPEILFELKEGVASLALNRPEKLNAMNRSMALELQDQLLACDEHGYAQCCSPAQACILFGSGSFGISPCVCLTEK